MGAMQVLGTVILALALLVALTPRLFASFGRALGVLVWRGQVDRRAELLARAQKARTKGAQEKAQKQEQSHDRMVEADQETQSPVIGFLHPFTNSGGGGERVLFAALQASQKRYPAALCIVYTTDQDVSKERLLEGGKKRFGIELDAAGVDFVYLPDESASLVLPQTYPFLTLLGQSLGSIVLSYRCLSLLVPDYYIDTTGYAFALWLCAWLFPSSSRANTRTSVSPPTTQTSPAEESSLWTDVFSAVLKNTGRQVPTAAYVHYPTISTDMLASLDEGEGSLQGGLHAGLGTGARGSLKRYYWHAFARLYGYVGGSIDIVMTNSSWTQNHVRQLWEGSRVKRRKANSIEVVYPPCAVGELERETVVDTRTEEARTRDILYVAQFRPEKMHSVVIDAFAILLRNHRNIISDTSRRPPRLVLAGSVRDPHDERRVYKLRLQAREAIANLPEEVRRLYSEDEAIEFVINAPWSSPHPSNVSHAVNGTANKQASSKTTDQRSLLDLLRSSSVGVNAMYNEHFGIGVVEYQAAGLVSVVSASGGPKADIVVNVDANDAEGGSGPTGFHASSVEDFAAGFADALSLTTSQALKLRLRARKSAKRFGEDVFEEAWIRNLEQLLAIA